MDDSEIGFELSALDLSVAGELWMDFKRFEGRISSCLEGVRESDLPVLDVTDALEGDTSVWRDSQFIASSTS